MKRIIIISVAFATLIFAVSCATSPEKAAKTAKEEKKTAEQKVSEKDIVENTETLRTEAETSLSAARNIKADVAMKEEFEKALALYERAQSEQEKGNYKKASDLFSKAKQLFEEVHQKTEEKRVQAEKSMDESKTQLQQLEEKAKAAGI